jgi:hypothetical protein
LGILLSTLPLTASDIEVNVQFTCLHDQSDDDSTTMRSVTGQWTENNLTKRHYVILCHKTYYVKELVDSFDSLGASLTLINWHYLYAADM